MYRCIHTSFLRVLTLSVVVLESIVPSTQWNEIRANDPCLAGAHVKPWYLGLQIVH